MDRRHSLPAAASERGVALVIVMLLLLLTSAILMAFLVTATGDLRLRAVDSTRTQALYAAHAGLEKLTADLGDLFAGDFSPEAEDLEAIEADPPALDNIAYTATDGLGYDIAFAEDDDGNPAASSGTIASGPFQGFIGLLTPYTLTVTSRTTTGAESRLQRTLQTVSIPVFQFGVFSETDLTFSANGTFSFGGRVHTNGNLFLAAAAGGVLYLREKVTAVGEVIRTHLANSRAIGTTHNGTVMVNKSTATCPGTSSPYTACKPLAANEGSLTGNIGSSANSNWMTIFGNYNGYLRNHLNGITTLELPLVSDEVGGTPIDMIRRPVPGEEALLTSQRLFDQASIRILLSDVATDITGLPGVSATAPVALAGDYVTPATTTPFLPPFAASPGNSGAACTNNGNCTPVGTPLLGGFLKVEYRNVDDVWVDVTAEWLNLGYTRRNFDRSTVLDSSTNCTVEPNTNAILRIQRVRANPSAGVTAGTICTTDVTPAVPIGTDFWPLTLYDIREAFNRDGSASSDLHMSGVIHYVDLDVNNLRLWLADTIAGTGELVVNEDGYVVYFSDRRGNRDAAGEETGEYGYEDIVNGATSAGTINGTLDDGEDMNSNGTLDTYGGTAYARTTANALTTAFPAGWLTPWVSGSTPYTTMGTTGNTGNPTSIANNPWYRARSNPPMFFRRALKLTNGGLGNLPADGLTITSENPVYVEGHYNAGPTDWGTGAPAAILADSITLLSAAWNTVLQFDGYYYGHGDTRSFYIPNAPGDREAANTWYRFAALAGKTRNWNQTWESGSFGTDGGVHNFLRLVEDWNASKTLNYKGSIASFFYSRQATGLFRCCDDVYTLPATRNLSFDTNFLNPQLLPPKTPMFRDVNATGFVQVTRRQ